jgi:amino acid transporter
LERDGLLGSFLNTLLYTAAPVYLFFLASNLAVIVLRQKDPQVERPYRVWGYPMTPIMFSATGAFLACSAIVYKPWVAVSALGILLAGVPLYWISRRGWAGRPFPPSPTTPAVGNATESRRP